MPASAIGTYIRNMRIQANISLRRLASDLGISAVFLGEVERGVRHSFPRERWARLMELVPAITLEGLERNSANSTALQLDLTAAPPQYQNLGMALARRLEKKDLSPADCDQLLELLGRWEGDK